VFIALCLVVLTLFSSESFWVISSDGRWFVRLVQLSALLAVLGAIVAEWLAASNGLGYLVLSGSFNFNTARSFASIIALAVIGTAFFAFMSWVERMISWKREGSDSTTTV
jgi:NitT/TauT family transport system permease protein